MEKFTKEELRKARKADLFYYLCANHLSEVMLISHCLRLKKNRSISIKENYCGYVDFATGEKGNSVDFLVKHLGYSIEQAVLSLNNITASNVSEMPQNEAKQRDVYNGNIVIPERNSNNNKVIDYLSNKRKISINTIEMLIKKGLLFEDKFHNCVFINSELDWGEIRGTSEKPFHGIVKNSRNNGFWWFRNYDGDEKEKAVFICESAIDAISLYELYRLKKESFPAVFVSIGGVTKQQTIDRLSKKRLVIAVDNDEAGDSCRERNKKFKSFIPKNCKDWNESLMKKNRKGEQKK